MSEERKECGDGETDFVPGRYFEHVPQLGVQESGKIHKSVYPVKYVIFFTKFL